MKSMTGYGRGKIEKEERQYQVEMKSVNSKYCDINIKLPRNMIYMEEKIKKEILNNISRGKIDVWVTYQDYGIQSKNIVLNKELAKQYLKQLKEVSEETNINAEIDIMDLVKLPEVLTMEEKEDETEKMWEEIKECVKMAIDQLVQMRMQEGNNIKQDLKQRLKKISEKIEQISYYSTGLIEEYVVKLEERMKEILKTDTIDEARLAQETVIYADKSSIEEELTRMKSHILQFEQLLEEQIPIGKKLDFIIQEMNRETNTIGSKSGKLEITNLVIEIKTQLEDIREQVQNIE